MSNRVLTRNPYLTHATSTSISFRWHTRDLTSCTLTIASEKFYTEPGHIHRQTVYGLTPVTNYPYTITIDDTVVFSATARTIQVTGELRFCVLGDTGVGSSQQRDIARQLDLKDPHFVIHTGDVIYPTGQREGYDPFYFNIYGANSIHSTSPRGLSKVAWYHVLSAHDYQTDGGLPHWENFDHPGVYGTKNRDDLTPLRREYTVRMQNVEFFMLDVYRSGDGTAQVDSPWLTAALAASTAQWKILVMDAPPYATVGASAHGSELLLRSQLEAVYAVQPWDLSFNGYNHHYMRSKPVLAGTPVAPGAGPVYITTGGGGQALYGVNPAPEAYVEVAASDWHLCYIRINGATLSGEATGRATIAVAPEFNDDKFTAAGHGLLQNDRITFNASGVLPSGIVGTTAYYVVNVLGDTFQVSLTQDGGGFDFGSNGSGLIRVGKVLDLFTMTT